MRTSCKKAIILLGSLIPCVAVIAGDPASDDRRDDFDWYHGEWKVHNQRVFDPEKGWETFEATVTAKPVLEGLGTVAHFRATIHGEPYEGLNIQLYDPEDDQWRVYWADTDNPEFTDPVVGGFEDGSGRFYKAYTRSNGEVVQVKFEWTEVESDSAMWEQYWTPDGGETWNQAGWIMEFERVKEP